ncbi:MAG: hypothetical protein NTX52_05350, partial [Planctomycetota bacterium]|nr:hypothetical protein [Planctomycetota bacterium]
LLLSVVAPALKKAKNAARKLVCATNLHQIALGARAYTTDNNGKLPIYTLSDKPEPTTLYPSDDGGGYGYRNDSNIRVRRFRVTETGVQWLPIDHNIEELGNQVLSVLRKTPLVPGNAGTMERQIELKCPYLVFPIQNGVRKCPLKIFSGNELITCAVVELACEKVDFWTFIDLRQYSGKTLTITAEDPPVGFFGVLSSNVFPGADTVYHEEYRPQFHFSSRRGWINDSNGLVYYKGQYHLFYQHNPYGVSHGNMTWGHALSKDMIHWQELPDAIHPDQAGDIYSGSGLVDWHNTSGLQKGQEKALVLFYTNAGGKPWSEGKPFTQSIAYSNDAGQTWAKYEGNPVVGHIKGRNRDPKVIWHALSRQWIMALYLDKNDYAILGSKDMRKWTHLSNLTVPGVAECPDLFEIPIEGSDGQSKWVFWGANGKYLIGDFDGAEFTAETEPLQTEWGNGAYAGQTWSDAPDGRRLWIGWMTGAWL